MSLFLSRHLSFVAFTVLAIDSFTSCFAQLRDVLNLRVSIKSMCRRQLSMRRLLRAGMIMWTHILLPFIASDWSLLLFSYATSKLKEKE